MLQHEAIESGLYETLQFPFCYLATDKDLELVQDCKKAGMGFIAMKALSGGLINNSAAGICISGTVDNVTSDLGECSGRANWMNFCPI